jgi:uncharacterized protein
VTMPKLIHRLLPELSALSLGLAGGWIAFILHVPLAFMIGAMVLTTAAAIAGVPVRVPPGLRGLMIAILGIMLGSAFSPTLLQHASEWSVSLLGLAVYIVVAAWAGVLYLRKVAGYDPVTAYFTAMPGGFNEMVLMGGAMGGNDRTIALGHSLRILLVVMTVPFAFGLLPGFDSTARDWTLNSLGPDWSALALQDWALLAACGVGAPLAHWLRIPAALLVGPMLLSAAIHLAGLTAVKPPGLLVAAAQIVVGSAIGCRFAGENLQQLFAAARVAAGLTTILLLITVLMALALHLSTGQDFAALILAYAPGGLAEMSLVALSLHIDAAFVATHHIVRIVIIIIAAPIVWHLLAARQSKT